MGSTDAPDLAGNPSWGTESAHAKVPDGVSSATEYTVLGQGIRVSWLGKTKHNFFHIEQQGN